MKIVKYVFSICLLVLAIYSCSQDDDSSDFVNSIEAPTNISANVVVTQDNTGLVTITPLGEGVTNFKIGFGDQSEPADGINPGNSVSHIYEEGTFEATITAIGLNGLTTTIVQSIIVSFQAPQDLMVTVENDAAVSKQVNITASAEFALSYEVDFGDLAGTTMMSNIEEPISFIYNDAGIYTITITAFSAAIETTQYVEEAFEVTEILQPVVPAPVPTRPAPNVISIYSDAYTPITVTELPTAWSGSGFDEIQVEGDNIIQYFDLDFTGIVTDYGNPTNLTTMDYVHFDYWTTDGVELGFKIVNTVSGQEDIESVGTVVQGEWVSIDIALNDFDMDRSQVTQLLFDNLIPDDSSITVFIDNLYFYVDTPTIPLVAAPLPTADPVDVIAIYSDTYTPITVTEFPTAWSGSGFEEIQIEGNNTIKYANLDFTGIVTDYGNPTDLTAMNTVHFDYWTADASELGIKLVNTVNGDEDIESVGTVTLGEWVSVVIPLDDFAMDRSQLTQILFDNLVPDDASITVYIDNLYFSAGVLNEPVTEAPIPTIDTANVISIYSDSYTPITVTELPTGWSGSGFEEIQIEGNNTIKYFDLDFTGIVTDYDNPTDLTAMTHVHFDYWSSDASELGIKLVNTVNGDEDIESVGTVTLGAWVSVDIALDDFAMDRSQLTQILFDNLVPDDASITVYIDNLYFYN
ncbi:hypothetical protein A9Q87_12870 [Flavobacteriales bacterium 34_180_T64]|nr:hypothetical protein A9Q87_12870 [Flavobacteriales bacterium 34_180_T64]